MQHERTFCLLQQNLRIIYSKKIIIIYGKTLNNFFKTYQLYRYRSFLKSIIEKNTFYIAESLCQIFVQIHNSWLESVLQIFSKFHNFGQKDPDNCYTLQYEENPADYKSRAQKRGH